VITLKNHFLQCKRESQLAVKAIFKASGTIKHDTSGQTSKTNSQKLETKLYQLLSFFVFNWH